MLCQAVIFDLYGTLVPPFQMREHILIMQKIARVLSVDFESLHVAWGKDFPRRIRGEFASVADNLASIAAGLGNPADPGALAEAERIYRTFTLEGLTPKPGAIQVLQWLHRQHIPLGLISNCSPDVVALWNQSPLAPYFSHCAFSSRERIAKPNPLIYRRTLDALGAPGERTLYVGDGSDQELSGAERSGMQAVLFVQDLSNTYDRNRPDVQNWTGTKILSFDELYPVVRHFKPKSDSSELKD
ncbi:MAG: HAD-IA family hydrolase [Firmicutes bacterium]|uniref:HAD family hydrolase n=1 Tax=Sulfobacillus benefaciens TaxID=453960 RepID=A0A2T2WZB5_9FIRM|nr:HAD-IA family hydrolase [Bacillota bacterium]PSR27577.1 MAG: hypothetical protein C7B43_11500 [Sulfobacillus benefaciens]